jgi:phosphoserine phosphatase
MLIGDGTSDLEAGEAVDLFVGYGGVIARERVRAGADVFIACQSLAPILPLALARPAAPPEHGTLYAEGVRLIQQGQVSFRDAKAHEGLLDRVIQNA